MLKAVYCWDGINQPAKLRTTAESGDSQQDSDLLNGTMYIAMNQLHLWYTVHAEPCGHHIARLAISCVHQSIACHQLRQSHHVSYIIHHHMSDIHANIYTDFYFLV